MGILTSSPSAEPRSEDFGRGTERPDGAKGHLNRFRQGHIIEDIPVVYVGSTNNAHWRAGTFLSNESNPARGVNVSIEEGFPLRHALILSQGCDIQKPHAWISVAPVYNALDRLDKGEIGNIRSGRTQHLLALAPPWATEGTFMVADLRLSVPVEKTVLLDREPLEAYTDASDYINVGIRLATLSGGRSDVADAVLDGVVDPFFAWTVANEFNEFTEVRVTQDSFHSPSVSGLFVITPQPDQIDPDVFEQAFPIVYEAASDRGITVEFVRLVSLETMTAAEYRSSQLVGPRDNSSS